MLPALLLLLFLTDGVYLETVCSYYDVIEHLNLSKTNERFQLTRPVKNYRNTTEVRLEVVLYAILHVVEKEQKFIPYLITTMRWKNDYISWDPQKFCGISNVSIPSELLWKPDIIIEEMTEKDKAPPSPYLTINDKGVVEVQSHQVVVSTCRLHIYKFPFDTQSCNLTFKSIVHDVNDVHLLPAENSSEATNGSREVMRIQYEWLFENITIIKINASASSEHNEIIYTISMKRRSLLYVVNFLLPVMFFLTLDMASYMISNADGGKVSFQVTVMLAITVLQLILCEILPSASERVPLIAVYCIGTFALMMLSLVETIVVMYLLRQDEKRARKQSEDCTVTQSNSNYQNCYGEKTNWTRCPSIYKAHTGETHSDVPVTIEDSNKLAEEQHTLERLSEELRGVEKALLQLFNNKKQNEGPGYWTPLARKFNKAFFFFYVVSVITFLSCLFTEWTT